MIGLTMGFGVANKLVPMPYLRYAADETCRKITNDLLFLERWLHYFQDMISLPEMVSWE
jgi:hypothetical protein